MCVRCGDYIGNYLTGDYYALLHRKYCDGCRDAAEQESTRLRVERFRLRNRQKNEEARRRLNSFEAENTGLRRRVIELRAVDAAANLTPEQAIAAAALLKLMGTIKEE